MPQVPVELLGYAAIVGILGFEAATRPLRGEETKWWDPSQDAANHTKSL